MPAPQLDAGDLDLDSGHFVMDDRGWFDRLTDYWLGDDDPDFQLEVMRSAEQKISDAAEETELEERAEENTQAMLEGFLQALGYETVTITFDTTAPDASAANAASNGGVNPMARNYGVIHFAFDAVLVVVTGGLWLIWIFVREMRRG